MSRNTLLIRRRRRMFRVPTLLWKTGVRRQGRRAAAGLGFMGPDHHRIRNLVVTEIIGEQQPVKVDSIAEALGLEAKRVVEILDELEAHQTFVHRSNGDDVDWAYPVTVAATPYRIRLDSGERLFGA